MKCVLQKAIGLMAIMPFLGHAVTDDEMLAKFRSLYPSTTITSVTASPIAGLWMIQMGRNVAYSDSAGRYLLFGAMLDSHTRTVIAQSSPSESNDDMRIAFPEEHLGLALKTVRGRGTHRLAVFSDPQCGYCKQLEPELAKLSDVTIYTFPYPVLGETSERLAQNTLCASDPLGAWTAVMSTGAARPEAPCDRRIEPLLALGKSLNISGTPTMISGNGRALTGARKASDIQAWLEQ